MKWYEITRVREIPACACGANLKPGAGSSVYAHTLPAL